MLVTERDREAANRATYLCAQGDFDALCSFLSEWRDEAVREFKEGRENLEGYRELGNRAATAENARDAALREFAEERERRVQAEKGLEDSYSREEWDGLMRRAEAAEARLRAVIEAANGLLTMTRDLLRRLDSHEPHEIDVNGVRRAIARYQGVRDAQPPASPEAEVKK